MRTGFFRLAQKMFLYLTRNYYSSMHTTMKNKLVYLLFIGLFALAACTKEDIEPPAVATVETLNASNIEINSARLSGYISDDGGATITERGFVYSRSSMPTIDNANRRTAGTGTGSFFVEIDDLLENTLYYARSYALNEAGISYGKSISFQTYRTCDFYDFGTITITNTSNNPYRISFDGYVIMDLPGKSQTVPLPIPAGNSRKIKAVQISGYIFSPAVRETIFDVKKCVDYTWQFP